MAQAMLSFFKQIFAPDARGTSPSCAASRQPDRSRYFAGVDVQPKRRLQTAKPVLETVYYSLDVVEDHIELGRGSNAGVDDRTVASTRDQQIETSSDDRLELVEDSDNLGFNPYDTGKFVHRNPWDMPRPK